MPRILQTEFWVVCSYVADMAVFKTWLCTSLNWKMFEEPLV